MKVDMNLLKQLRDLTFAPLKDCKDCLVEAEGDLDKAQELLKKKGLIKAAKKSDRETNEGIVKVAKKGDFTVGIKLACETDFVTRNELFLELADKILETVASYGKAFESLSQMDESFVEGKINPLVQESISKIGENIRLVDAFIKSGNSYIYEHPGNKLIAIIHYQGDSEEIAKEIALQVAAMNPEYLDKDSVPAQIMDKLKNEIMEELKASGKPAEMLGKIAEGKINKNLTDFVLTEQIYIRDETKKIKDILPNGFKIIGFTRFSI